jgi:hypothetical protein
MKELPVRRLLERPLSDADQAPRQCAGKEKTGNGEHHPQSPPQAAAAA